MQVNFRGGTESEPGLSDYFGISARGQLAYTAIARTRELLLFTPPPIPEPATASIVALAMAALVLRRRACAIH